MTIKEIIPWYCGVFSLIVFFCCTLSCKDNSQTQGNTSIRSFTIIGTSPISNGAIPISSDVNNGVFSINWNVISSDPYSVKLFVSEDPILSKNSDIEFLNQNCGSASNYGCSTLGEFSCSFSSAKNITCAGGLSGINLSTILDQSPKVVYILIEACNEFQTECQTNSVKVEFKN